MIAALASLLLSASAVSDGQPYRALAEAYIEAFGSCDAEILKGLFSDDHRGFVIEGGTADGFSAPAVMRKCQTGYIVSVKDSDIASLDHGGGFGTALLEIRAQTTGPEGRETTEDLRVSLMMEDRGTGPLIVRSHISAAR